MFGTTLLLFVMFCLFVCYDFCSHYTDAQQKGFQRMLPEGGIGG